MEKYSVLDEVGKGSFGVVCRCRCLMDNKVYVVKIIDLHAMPRDEQENTLAEVRLLHQLDNPFIVRYRESFFDDNKLHIVMKYCSGGELSGRVKNAKQRGVFLDEGQIMAWFVQVCLAVQYCHSLGIIHRDLKSQNIFLTKSGNCRLGDFGIARVLGTENFASTMIGTPYSMAPEVIQQYPYGAKSDVWALGCVLYELCALRNPFESKTLPQLMWKIVNDEPPSLPDHVSSQVQALVTSLLAKDPDKRPTVDDVLHSPFLKECIQQQLQSLRAEGEGDGGDNGGCEGESGGSKPFFGRQNSHRAEAEQKQLFPRLSSGSEDDADEGSRVRALEAAGGGGRRA